MANPPRAHMGPDGHRLICPKQHRVEGENRGVMQTAEGERVYCRICRKEANRIASEHRADKTVQRTLVRREWRRLPIQVAMTPAQLAEARAELEAVLHRERQIRGAKGGRPHTVVGAGW